MIDQLRFEEFEAEQYELTEETLALLAALYLAMKRETVTEIHAFYGRYAQDGKVSYQDSKKKLTPEELKEFREDIERFKENASPEWEKTLEKLSEKIRVSRLDWMLVQLQNKVETLKSMQLELMDELAQKSYETQFKNVTGEQSSPDNVSLTPWAADGKAYPERIEESSTSTIALLIALLARAFIMGKTSDSLIKEIHKVFTTSENRAITLFHTENAAFASRGTKKAYEKMGVKNFKFVAILDNRTSLVCRSLNGKVFPISQYKIGINVPPLHPHCRSITIPV